MLKVNLLAWLRGGLLLLVGVVLQGCSTLSYYSQSIAGHLELMGQRRSLSQVIEDTGTDEHLKQTLQVVEKMRQFASRELGLPDNDSYRSYVALDRDAVLWSVVATAEFSVQPRQWCYLVIGCASYRGYFAKDSALAYAHSLQQQGLDVAVEPVPAYSTLGWFDDPLPSTVTGWPLPRVAELMFHELAHQQLYIEDDSAFNEAFATLVAEVGTERWLAGEGEGEGEGEGDLALWRQAKARQSQFVALLLSARESLQQLYTQSQPAEQMRQNKQRLFKRLIEDYQQLKRQWGGYSGYDHWFERELNNAHLALVATYESLVPAFRSLFRQVDDRLPEFYRASEQLGRMSRSDRRRRMLQLRNSE